jgi:hypothetical protein
MKPPAAKSKHDFGSFHIHHINVHYERLVKAASWKLSLVKNEKSKASIRRVLLPGGLDSSPLRLCCHFSDLKNPTIRCKDHDYFHNLEAGDKIHLLFGKTRPKDQRLLNRLPAPGAPELEIQPNLCTVKAGTKVVEFFSKQRGKSSAPGMLARFSVTPFNDTKIKTKARWEVLYGREDSSNLSEEPTRLCCLLEEKNGKADKNGLKQIHGRCVPDPFLKLIASKPELLVYKARTRKPARNRLAPQLKCLPLPLPTKQQWMQTAFPTPIPDDDATVEYDKAMKAMKHFQATGEIAKSHHKKVDTYSDAPPSGDESDSPEFLETESLGSTRLSARD